MNLDEGFRERLLIQLGSSVLTPKLRQLVSSSSFMVYEDALFCEIPSWLAELIDEYAVYTECLQQAAIDLLEKELVLKFTVGEAVPLVIVEPPGTWAGGQQAFWEKLLFQVKYHDRRAHSVLASCRFHSYRDGVIKLGAPELSLQMMPRYVATLIEVSRQELGEVVSGLEVFRLALTNESGLGFS